MNTFETMHAHIQQQISGPTVKAGMLWGEFYAQVAALVNDGGLPVAEEYAASISPISQKKGFAKSLVKAVAKAGVPACGYKVENGILYSFHIRVEFTGKPSYKQVAKLEWVPFINIIPEQASTITK